jgi:hypothetical protein
MISTTAYVVQISIADISARRSVAPLSTLELSLESGDFLFKKGDIFSASGYAIWSHIEQTILSTSA